MISPLYSEVVVSMPLQIPRPQTRRVIVDEGNGVNQRQTNARYARRVNRRTTGDPANGVPSVTPRMRAMLARARSGTVRNGLPDFNEDEQLNRALEESLQTYSAPQTYYEPGSNPSQMADEESRHLPQVPLWLSRATEVHFPREMRDSAMGDQEEEAKMEFADPTNRDLRGRYVSHCGRHLYSGSTALWMSRNRQDPLTRQPMPEEVWRYDPKTLLWILTSQFTEGMRKRYGMFFDLDGLQLAVERDTQFGNVPLIHQPVFVKQIRQYVAEKKRFPIVTVTHDKQPCCISWVTALCYLLPVSLWADVTWFMNTGLECKKKDKKMCSLVAAANGSCMDKQQPLPTVVTVGMESYALLTRIVHDYDSSLDTHISMDITNHVESLRQFLRSAFVPASTFTTSSVSARICIYLASWAQHFGWRGAYTSALLDGVLGKSRYSELGFASVPLPVPLYVRGAASDDVSTASMQEDEVVKQDEFAKECAQSLLDTGSLLNRWHIPKSIFDIWDPQLPADGGWDRKLVDMDE